MKYGMIATGSKEASHAALDILKLGGNAFDASISAVITSMTSEINLTSMAGGGAMLAYKKGNNPILYDFFVDAPPIRDNKSFEFYKTKIDFGGTEQLFHIGKGSVAIPGNIKGLLHAHSKLGVLPLSEILSPAKDVARNGVVLSKSQSYITSLLEQILNTSEATKKIFHKNGKLISEGDTLFNPDFADFLDWIGEEGDRPFYEGEIGKKLVSYLGDDGLIKMDDLNSYKVFEREPLRHVIKDKFFFTNPSPSVGGTLIVFFLELLKRVNKDYQFDHNLLIQLMIATTNARYRFYRDPNSKDQLNQLLKEDILDYYSNAVSKNSIFNMNDFLDNGLGSTTHVSIIDRMGNASSITTTNGESCGHIIPGTGVILNNMLGEQDLNPLGFHNWIDKKRMPTLISPSMIIDKNGEVHLTVGSAGSNRIRSAISQVMMNYLIKEMNLREAVNAPRLHLENSDLFVEPDIKIDTLGDLGPLSINKFKDLNLFFGGVNAVSKNEAVSDPRRGGFSIEC